MRTDELQQLSAWLAATDIRLLELSGPGVHLRLQHDGAGVEVVDDAPAEIPRSVVRAGSVGIFLHRHPLHEAPLAPPGARIRTSQTLGLLRIGSLLLPVSAPGDGTVVNTLVSHGETVGFGTPLLEYQPIREES